MSFQKGILLIAAGSCAIFSVAAQEHPDAMKLVEDTSDNVAVAQEYVQQGMTYYTDFINLKNFDYKTFILAVGLPMAQAYGSVYFGSEIAAVTDKVGQASDAAQSAQDKVGQATATVQDKAGQASDAAQSAQDKASAAGATGDESAAVEGVEPITIKQLDGGDTSGADVLTSILPTASLPPIVPDEIASLLEEEQPDPAKVKEKIAEIVLIDKSTPKQLHTTQDLQNRLVAAGVMRALDNAKRSFELSAKAQEEIDADRQKVQDATTFTGVLSATALASVHSFQKLNEIKGLYAQMMELDALGSLRGAELTDEEREKRAEEATKKESVAVSSSDQIQETAALTKKARSSFDQDALYECLKSTMERRAERISNHPSMKEKTKKGQLEGIQRVLARAEEQYQEYKTCKAKAERSYCDFGTGVFGVHTTGLERQECWKKARVE